MPTDLLKQVIPHLSPSLAAALFQRLDEDLQRAILFRVPERYAQEIRSYMTYPAGIGGQYHGSKIFSVARRIDGSGCHVACQVACAKGRP